MALATMTRWSRSHNFCAVVLLLSPTISSSFRASSSSFSQIRFSSHTSRSPRKYSSPLETADPSYVSDNEVVVSNYKRGQPITFSVLRFGPMGASVSIDNEAAYGLVLQREISLFRDSRDGVDIEIGEVIEGFVERVRDDGKIDVSIRPLGVSRIVVVKQLVFDAIDGSPSGSIPLGDKSTPEDIASYFHGISKKDFKNAIGSLYREGLVSPGGLVTSLVPDSDRQTSKITAEATKVKKASADTAVRAPRVQSDRDTTRSVFIGNLPNKISRDEVLKSIVGKLGKGVVTDLRLSLDENKRPRGFGYVELKEESMVEGAIADLNGLDVGGRVLRSDYADPTRRQKAGGASLAPKAPVSQGEGEEAPSAWKQGFKSRLSAAVGAASARIATATTTAAAAVPESAPVSASAVVKTGNSLIGAVTSERKALRAEGDKGDKGAVRERAVTPGGSESKSWVLEAERSLKFKKPTSPSSYSLNNESARRGPGSVASVRFPTDKENQRSKGYAFVDIHKVSDAKRIFEEMHGYEMMGKPCNIDDATRN